MTEKEMMLDVLERLKSSTQKAIYMIEMDMVRDNINPTFTIPDPYTMRIGDFLIVDEKVKLIGNSATMHCQKLEI